ncbi:MAG TPA: helix-turn-helix transcriptional regulator [Mogibacterium sp.]|nr:helix-turn-helix transcriptional regulator [Mogibacterium sp.]
MVCKIRMDFNYKNDERIMLMSIGEKLYKLRKRESISQEMLADSINVSRQTISKWEQDSVTPDTANLVKICNYFKVPIEYFAVENYEISEFFKKKHINNGLMLIIGLVILLGSVLSTYLMQINEYKLYGQFFDNALNYLQVFPLNLVFAIGTTVSIFGVYRIVKRRKKK